MDEYLASYFKKEILMSLLIHNIFQFFHLRTLNFKSILILYIVFVFFFNFLLKILMFN